MITLNREVCTACGTCVMVCPHHVFELDAQSAIIAHEERCIECGACDKNCHDGAIMVTKGTGCLVAIIKEDILKIKPTGNSCGCC